MIEHAARRAGRKRPIVMLTALLMSLAVLAGRASAEDAPRDPGHCIVFVHGGGKKERDARNEAASAIAKELAKSGYVVRSPDQEQDVVGGPAVDYFDEADLACARAIAAVVNANTEVGKLQEKPIQLAPRRQRIKNQPGYIGVWLF
jgi:hypothetical protein